MSVLVKLYKLAYTLDRKGLHDEAKKIEDAMKVMTERVGLTAEDIVALADHFDQEGDIALANYFDDLLKEAKKKNKGKPPKKWWDKMEKEIKNGNPDYSDEQVAKTIGDIWFHDLSDKKREQIAKRDRKRSGDKKD